MQAYEIMMNRTYKVKESDTVRSVIEKFIAYRISGLPVVNDSNEIVAYISDGDIMRYIGKYNDFVIDTFFFATVIKGDDEDFLKRAQRLLLLAGPIDVCTAKNDCPV